MRWAARSTRWFWAVLALVLSRLIDNSVVVLENIFRHLEEGEDAVTAAEQGGKEVALAVLAATFTTAIVFFPVVFLSGVSKYLFTALALGVVLALAASYLVAMSVVPLFCSRFIKSAHGTKRRASTNPGGWSDSLAPFNRGYDYVLSNTTSHRESAGTSQDHSGVIMGGVRAESGAIPAARCFLLPAHRSRPVRD